MQITLEKTPAGAPMDSSSIVESFKHSSDTHFIENLEDIVGLYLDSTGHALMLC